MKESGTVERRKAVFIDGENFRKMVQDVLGIKAGFETLREILMREVGQLTVLAEGSPLITLPTTGMGSLGHALSLLNFNVVQKDPQTKEDDRYIVGEIEKVDPAKIGEVVIVAADQGYIDPLLKLVDAGVRVYWVATRHPSVVNQRPPVGERLEGFLGNQFEFVELFDYKERITMSPYVSKGPTTEVTITLKITRARTDALKFADMVRGLQEAHKDLCITTELKPMFEQKKRETRQQP